MGQGTVGRGQALSRRSEAAAQAALALTESAARRHWHGPDPFDGLWWSWPAPLVSGKLRRQAIAQAHARSPVDFRPLYRRRHPLLTKAAAAFASSAVRLWTLTGRERYRELALDALDTIDADVQAGDAAWGYCWDVQTRWSFYQEGSPNIVVTTFAAHALRDAADAWGIDRYAERARRATEWVRDSLWLADPGYFVYHPGSAVLIHNANLLGAALVRRILPDEDAARRALEVTLEAQSPDGSWPYGAGADNLAFVDSFHTGYVLTCLATFAGDPAVDAALQRGAAHYAAQFFDGRGRATMWAGRPYPEDAHSAGTGLSTLAILSGLGLVEPALIELVLDRVLSHVIQGEHTVHRRNRRYRTFVRYMRWCDAHVALGLAGAARALAPA